MGVIARFRTRRGKLFVGGVCIDKIVAHTGAPVYVYDADIMRDSYNRLVNALPDKFRVYYSVKANSNIAVAKVFSALGSGAETASAGEISLALSAGFRPDDIIFAGPGKGTEEIKLAMKKRIGSINVESETELGRILQAAGTMKRGKSKPRVAIRVNLDMPPIGAGELMTGGPKKFGVDAERMAPLALTAARDDRVDFTGFHFYPGTAIMKAGALGRAYRAFARWAERFCAETGLEIKTMNFGGGLGIPFRENEPELDVEAVGKTLGVIAKRLGRLKHFKHTRFMIEPGRYLVGPSGVYVSRVTDMKTSRGQRYVITDGGVHHALIPITLNRNYPTTIVNKMNKPSAGRYQLAGPLCMGADQFSRKVSLPQPAIGDLVGVFNSGAYGFSAGMLYFLSRPTPAEAMVDNGRLFIIRKPAKPGHGAISEIKLST